jgi:hypothetical protein
MVKAILSNIISYNRLIILFTTDLACQSSHIMLFVSTTRPNNACKMEKDSADVRERILLVRHVRVNNEIAAMVAEKVIPC